MFSKFLPLSALVASVAAGGHGSSNADVMACLTAHCGVPLADCSADSTCQGELMSAMESDTEPTAEEVSTWSGKGQDLFSCYLSDCQESSHGSGLHGSGPPTPEEMLLHINFLEQACEAANNVGDMVGDMVNDALDTLDGLGDDLDSVLDGLGDGLEDVLDGLGDGLDVLDGLGDGLEDVLDGVGNIDINIDGGGVDLGGLLDDANALCEQACALSPDPDSCKSLCGKRLAKRARARRGGHESHEQDACAELAEMIGHLRPLCSRRVRRGGHKAMCLAACASMPSGMMKDQCEAACDVVDNVDHGDLSNLGGNLILGNGNAEDACLAACDLVPSGMMKDQCEAACDQVSNIDITIGHSDAHKDHDHDHDDEDDEVMQCMAASCGTEYDACTGNTQCAAEMAEAFASDDDVDTAGKSSQFKGLHTCVMRECFGIEVNDALCSAVNTVVKNPPKGLEEAAKNVPGLNNMLSEAAEEEDAAFSAAAQVVTIAFAAAAALLL